MVGKIFFVLPTFFCICLALYMLNWSFLWLINGKSWVMYATMARKLYIFE